MGMFKKKVRVLAMNDASKAFTEDFWVDTRALYSFVPEDALHSLGVEPSDTRNIVLADGRVDRRLFGFCFFEVEGLTGRIPCPVIFAPKGSLYLLGATALENFGVAADPVNKTLTSVLSVIG